MRVEHLRSECSRRDLPSTRSRAESLAAVTEHVASIEVEAASV
jgi:hypothetical protein